MNISWKAILIGVILIPINVYWIVIMDLTDQSYPTTVSIYFNVVFTLFALTGLNLGIKYIKPGLGLKQGELLTVYIMLAIASSLAGCDFLIILMSSMNHPFWYASPENEWADLFFRYIPNWITVTDQQTRWIENPFLLRK